MLIVEGPDGGGKSTLVKSLHQTLGWPISPRVVSKETQALVDIDTWLERDLELGARKRIYDRHRMISEPIYGPLIRGHMAGRMGRRVWLAQQWLKFRQVDPLIVMCLPPRAVVLENLKNDPDNEVILPHAVQIYWLYYCQTIQLQTSQMNVFLWDYTYDGPGDPFVQLTTYIDWWSQTWPLTTV